MNQVDDFRYTRQSDSMYSPILLVGPGTVEGGFIITFSLLGSIYEVPCAGERVRGRDTLVEGTWVGVVVG